MRAAGIPVAVVPGITAAQGLAASLGVSLTHRDHAQSLTFVTGHSSAGEMPETMDWSRLADKNATTILYMAGRTAGRISGRLIAEGLSPDTAVVAMTSISRPDSKLWSGKLERLAEGVAGLPLGAPILIGVGSVFSDAGFRTEARAAPEGPERMADTAVSNTRMRPLLASGTFA